MGGAPSLNGAFVVFFLTISVPFLSHTQFILVSSVYIVCGNINLSSGLPNTVGRGWRLSVTANLNRPKADGIA
jgi:hypothetical protein